MQQDAHYRVSVKGIYQDVQGRYVLNQKDGLWGMPGGGIEHGETHQEAIIREIDEELGLEVISITPQPEFFLTRRSPNDYTYKAIVMYRIDIASIDDYRPSDESDAIGFFDVQELKAMKQDHRLWTSGWVDSL